MTVKKCIASNADKVIYIRKEGNEQEHRTPITPKDVNVLITNGFIVYIQSSKTRIYSDKEYKKSGAIVTNRFWYDIMFRNALIVGLKEVKELDKLLNHRHLYFSHSYKKQIGYETILSAFSKGISILYDFEYFVDKSNKRIISFGFYAGVVGCVLGLLQYLKKQHCGENISNLAYWNTKDEIIKYIQTYIHLFEKCKIVIIGANGNCGIGVKSILDELNIPYEVLGKNDNKTNLQRFDILYNCINLGESADEIWFDKNTKFDKPIIITDISCDYSKPNNPIQIYSENTTWSTPVYSYNNYVDIIAVNNLPSLLPKESSDYFSSKCTDLILGLGNDIDGHWKNNENIFYEKIGNLDENISK